MEEAAHLDSESKKSTFEVRGQAAALHAIMAMALSPRMRRPAAVNARGGTQTRPAAAVNVGEPNALSTMRTNYENESSSLVQKSKN